MNKQKSKKEIEKYIDFLSTTAFFHGLETVHINSLVYKSRVHDFNKSSHLFYNGEPAEKFYIMLEGWVKLYRMNREGEETVTALVTKGDVFSEVATFEGSDYTYSAQVVGGNAKCIVMPAFIIREKVKENPQIALKMLSSMAHRTNQLGLAFEHITKLTTAQRLGCFLLKLSMDREFSTELQFPYSKNLVASRLGMYAETFSRAMKRLNKDLSIEFKGRNVIIPNIKKLETYCEIECYKSEENSNFNCGLETRLRCHNTQCDIYRILKLM